MNDEKYIIVKNLKKYFSTKRGKLHAVDDVSFEIKKEIGRASCRERV